MSDPSKPTEQDQELLDNIEAANEPQTPEQREQAAKDAEEAAAKAQEDEAGNKYTPGVGPEPNVGPRDVRREAVKSEADESETPEGGETP